MKKALVFIFALLCALTSHAQQFRLVGNLTGFATVVDDSTYNVSLSFPSDLTGNSFLPTQIVDDGSYRIFFQTGRIYTVTGVANATFSDADLTLVEYGSTDGSPTGQALVFDPQGRESVPQSPLAANGASGILNSAIFSYNLQFQQGFADGDSNDLVLSPGVELESTTYTDAQALFTAIVASLNTKVDTLYERSDSLFYQVGGVETLFAVDTGGGGSLVDGDYGDVTVSGSGTVITINGQVVTFAKFQDIPENTFVGRDEAGTGSAETLTPAEARTLLNVEDGATADQTATDVPITDAGAYYTGTDVEAALQEVADTLTGLRTDLSAIASGAADGVATAGAYDGPNEEIDVTVAAPGADFSIDVSSLASDSELGDSTAQVRSEIPTTASDLPIVDAGGYYTTSDVESALQEEAVNRVALDQLVGDLIVLSGVPITSQDLGTFTGTTISDNNDVKGALQELETAVESGGSGSGIDYVIQSTAPADTTKLWIDNSPGNSKIWDINQRVGGAWEKIKYYDPVSGYVSALPPVYILGTGQSNMLYRPTGGDLTVDQRVVEWRNGAWEICDRTAGNANNLALQFAKNLAEDEDRIVRFAVIAEGSRPIEDWYPDSTKFNEIVEFIDSAQVDQLDLILWRQGERNSDLGDTESEYAAKFDSVFNVFRDSTWFGQKGEIVTANLNEAYPLTTGVQTFFLNLATSNSTDSRISVSSSFGLAPGLGGNHIDGASIDTAGYRMYQAWKGRQLDIWERDGTTITSYNSGDNLNIDGTLGVGVTSPARKVEIYQPATATPELRLSHTVGTHYADFDVNSTGELRLTSSSGAYYFGSTLIGPLPSATGSVTMAGGSLNITGTANTLFGTQSGNALTSGIRNTMLGNGAGLLSNGNSNVYIGYRNFQSNVSSFGITSFGVEAGKFHTTGNSLLVAGFNAAQALSGGGNATSFSNGVYLGPGVKVGVNGATNEIVLGFGAEGDGSNTARIGNSSMTKLSSGNYSFNVDQSTTGLDGYVMTYNESNDELELQSGSGFTDGNGIYSGSGVLPDTVTAVNGDGAGFEVLADGIDIRGVEVTVNGTPISVRTQDTLFIPIYAHPHDEAITTGSADYRGWRVPADLNGAKIEAIQYSFDTPGSDTVNIQLTNGTVNIAGSTIPIAGYFENTGVTQTLTTGEKWTPSVSTINGTGHEGLMVNLMIVR